MYGTQKSTTYYAIRATLNAWQGFAERHYKAGLFYPGIANSWKDVFWRIIAADAIAKDYSDILVGGEAGSNGKLQVMFRKLNGEDRELHEALWLRMAALTKSNRFDGDSLLERSTWSYFSEEKALIFGLAVHASTLRRRFFITQKGLMGTGPPETSPGDKVVILFGGRVPFLLREQARSASVTKENDNPSSSSETHEDKVFRTLLGDCYVHGIMDGEALDGWEGESRRYWLR